MACQCPPDSLEVSFAASEAGKLRKLRIDRVSCKLCGRKWRVKTVGSQGTILCEATSAVTPPPEEPLGQGPGTALHEAIAMMGMPTCQQCKSLARKMNAWGVDGCREHFDEIVEDILPRAKRWWENATYKEKMSVWWKSDNRLHSAFTAARTLPANELDGLLRSVVGQQVLVAIATSEQRGAALPVAEAS